MGLLDFSVDFYGFPGCTLFEQVFTGHQATRMPHDPESQVVYSPIIYDN